MQINKITLSLILACVLSISMYAQKDDLDRYSLPVFEIIDSTFAGIVDDFILNAQKEGYTDSVSFSIYAYTSYSIVRFKLYFRKQNKCENPLILYKHPECFQALIKHQNILFRAYFFENLVNLDYYELGMFFRIMPNRQNVYFKDPPLGFYRMENVHDYPFENTILESGRDYMDGEWFEPMVIVDIVDY